MSNGETLQEYNTNLSENNDVLDNILTMVNNLPEGGSVGASNIYSTSEIRIGTWIDGKPLYRKVVNYGPLPNNDAVSVEHGISDIDKIVNFYGIALRSDNDALLIPYITFNPDNFGGILMNMNSTGITIRTVNDRSPYNTYVTVEYTKTTDTGTEVN